PVLLQACRSSKVRLGKSASPSPVEQGPPQPVQALLDARVGDGAKPGLDVFQGGSNHLAGMPTYVAFGLGAEGSPSFGTDATIWLVPDPASGGTGSGPLPARYHAYAHPDGPPPLPQGVHSAIVTFDRPGIWYLVADAVAGGGRRAGWAAFEVYPKERSTTPYPGQPAIPSETPTVGDHRGVNPICTRNPACDMHQVTLASALRSGKPVAFTIGTPAFCQSRVCGPNLDELIAVEKDVGSRAVFVHAEVYRDDKPETIQRQDVGPTFREWGLNSEPWLFLIDRKATVASRFEGPLTADQIKVALNALL
ncbi:MAG TPA: hypothetical protein VII47_11285, partial [Actinomycetota bacterium]